MVYFEKRLEKGRWLNEYKESTNYCNKNVQREYCTIVGKIFTKSFNYDLRCENKFLIQYERSVHYEIIATVDYVLICDYKTEPRAVVDELFECVWPYCGVGA